MVVVLQLRHTIPLFGCKTPKQVMKYLCWATRLYFVSFSADSLRLVSGCSDKTIRIWDTDSGKAFVGPLKGHSYVVVWAVFSPDWKAHSLGLLGQDSSHLGFSHWCIGFSYKRP